MGQSLESLSVETASAQKIGSFQGSFLSRSSTFLEFPTIFANV